MACRVSATLIGRCLCLRLFVCFCRFVALSPCRACFSSLRPTVKRVACGGIYLLFCYLHIPSPQWCVFFFCFSLCYRLSLSLLVAYFWHFALRAARLSFCFERLFLSNHHVVNLGGIVFVFPSCCHSFSHFVFIGNRCASFRVASVSFIYERSTVGAKIKCTYPLSKYLCAELITLDTRIATNKCCHNRHTYCMFAYDTLRMAKTNYAKFSVCLSYLLYPIQTDKFNLFFRSRRFFWKAEER